MHATLAQLRARRAALLILLIATLWPQFGCWESRQIVRPIRSERNVQMFGRYSLDIHGLGEEPFPLICDISFLQKHGANSQIDSIPVFVIDSFCFEGACLSYRWCVAPKISSLGSRSNLPDIVVTDGKIVPYGYYAANAVPPECNDSEFRVGIHARLLDRKTGALIGSELKVVRLKGKLSGRPTIG